MTSSASARGDVLFRSLEIAPAAYAAARGPAHDVIFMNAAFRRLANLHDDSRAIRPLAEVFPGRDKVLAALLDKAALGVATTNAQIDALTSHSGAEEWFCTVWPVANDAGVTECCMIEMHEVPLPDTTLRDVAEQLLLSSLRETELAHQAEVERRRAVYLADAMRRLTESLDVETTLAAIAVLALPSEDSWCIVDVVASDGAMRRVSLVHHSDDKHAAAAALSGKWQPGPGDFFGLPIALRLRASHVVERVSDVMLEAAAQTPANLALLRRLDFRSVLTVPLMVRGSVIGAVTFVKGRQELPFTEADINLAETMCARSALALDNARLFAQAEWQRLEAEKSDQAKSDFLKHMSHELRTPLNAILGYVELIDSGMRGPVSESQHSDLGRIKQSTQHIIRLISEILDYTRVSGGGARYNIAEVVVANVINRAADILKSLGDQRGMRFQSDCDTSVIAVADPDRLEQIIINLVSNAIKYATPGGEIRMECAAENGSVRIVISDEGPGISPENLKSIFEPFVQIGHHASGDGGVGLGLAISHDLALAMNGNLTAESSVDGGSRFTLTLPRAG